VCEREIKRGSARARARERERGDSGGESGCLLFIGQVPEGAGVVLASRERVDRPIVHQRLFALQARSKLKKSDKISLGFGFRLRSFETISQPPVPSGSGPTHTVDYRGTSLIRNRHTLGTYSRPMPRALWWSQGGWRFLMNEVPLYDPFIKRHRATRN